MLEHCGYLSINNADRLLFQDAPLILRERDEAREQLGEMVKALAPLVAIANRYDDNGLDDEARKFWGKNDEFKNDKKPSDIELYSGRGGKQLLVLADCLTAREIVSKHTTTKGGSQS
jgi:hypothetical protein